jgi:valyl-tRNA synthetase
VKQPERLLAETFAHLCEKKIIIQHQVAAGQWQWFIHCPSIRKKIERLLRQAKVSFLLPNWLKHFSRWLSQTEDLPICQSSATTDPPRAFYQWFNNATLLAKHSPISLLIADFTTFFSHLAPMLVLSVYLSPGNPLRDIAIFGRMQLPARKPAHPSQPEESAATHFILAAKARPGSISISGTPDSNTHRTLINKIKHAYNYIKRNSNQGEDPMMDFQKLSPTDQWILHQLNKTIQQVTDHLDGYRIDRAASHLYQFFIRQYCRWYLEFSRENRSNPPTSKTLRYSLQQILAMLQIFSPDLCHDILDRLNTSGKTIPFPSFDSRLVFIQSFREVEWLKRLITLSRKIRGRFQLPATKKIGIRLASNSPVERERIERYMEHILQLGFFSRGEVVAQMDARWQGLQFHADTIQVMLYFRQEEERLLNLKRLIQQREDLKRKIDHREKKLGNSLAIKTMTLQEGAALKMEYQKWIRRMQLLEQAIDDLQ